MVVTCHPLLTPLIPMDQRSRQGEVGGYSPLQGVGVSDMGQEVEDRPGNLCQLSALYWTRHIGPVLRLQPPHKTAVGFPPKAHDVPSVTAYEDSLKGAM